MKKFIALFLLIFSFCSNRSLDLLFNRAEALFLQLQPASAHAEERSVTVKPKKGAETTIAAEAKYFAIIIGNNNYKNLPKLKTAANDAKEVERILKSQYGFETKLLIDATRNEILTGINDFRKKLGQNDNFLIYYAGHGEFDKTADKSYWLPVDAQNDNPANWIIADDITSNIKRIASRHILLVSDSCYSGTLTRAVSTDLSTKGGREEFINKMMERPSRTLMASGGNEPVADEGGSGDHSVFASAFLKALKEADKGIFTAEELFHGRVKEIVAGKSDQVPEYNNIKNSGHEGGDFVFMAKASAGSNAGSGFKPEPAEELKNIQQEKERLKSERQALEQQKAIMEEKNQLEEERQKLEKEKTEIAMAKAKGEAAITLFGNLQWSRDANPAGNGKALTWKGMTWDEANDYIKELNRQNYMGSSDWRLPTKEELEKLIEYAKEQGGKENFYEFFNSKGFKNAHGLFWSSTTTGYAANPAGYAWYMYNGIVYETSKGEKGHYVWPVRSGQ